MFATKGNSEARKRSERIDKMLKDHNRELSRYRKLLLLGTSESGKSTMLKQMKFIHRGDLNDYKPDEWRVVLVENLVECLVEVCVAAGRFGLERRMADKEAMREILRVERHRKQREDVGSKWGGRRTEKGRGGGVHHDQDGDSGGGSEGVAPTNHGTRDARPSYIGPPTVITPDLKTAILRLVQDEVLQECIRKYGNTINLLDSAEYLFENAPRILAPSYIPTVQDIIRARNPTNGVTETRICMEGILYKVFDVAGSRHHRHTWVPFFDDCLAIFFVVALSSYDQTLLEDSSVNRVAESLDVFDQICNHPLLTRTTMMLFLNKIDLFKSKLKRSRIANYFPDYQGPQDYESACKYFARRFLNLNQVPNKSIYVHYTWATDTKQIGVVLGVVNRTIVKLNLQAAGFM